MSEPERAPVAAGEPLLGIENLRTSYGRIEALKGISMEVRDGEIVTLIGVERRGQDDHAADDQRHHRARVRARSRSRARTSRNEPAHEIVKLGIAQSPEGRRLFPRMTVRENLELGAYQRDDVAGIAEDLDRSYGLFPRLKERESQKAGTLSGGEQQMCAIGRALMARPRLLLLDEPSMGLAPILVDRIFEIIVEINKQGTTVLVVEQNASIALSVANRGYVLETGEIKLSDDAAALRSNDEVRKLYLGEI